VLGAALKASGDSILQDICPDQEAAVSAWFGCRSKASQVRNKKTSFTVHRLKRMSGSQSVEPFDKQGSSIANFSMQLGQAQGNVSSYGKRYVDCWICPEITA